VGNTGVRVKDLLEIDLGLVDKLPQFGHLADLLEGQDLMLLVAVDGETGRVITTVLEAGET
jgi:hypothetical protein